MAGSGRMKISPLGTVHSTSSRTYPVHGLATRIGLLDDGFRGMSPSAMHRLVARRHALERAVASAVHGLEAARARVALLHESVYNQGRVLSEVRGAEFPGRGAGFCLQAGP